MAGNDATDINYMLLATESLNKFSSSQFASASVQSQTLELLTNVANTQSLNMMNSLTAIAAQMNSMMQNGWVDPNNGKTYYAGDPPFDDEMNTLSTQYSTVEQAGTLNVQMLQTLIQATQTGMETTMKGIQGMASMFGVYSQVFQQLAGLLTQIQ